MNFYLSLYKAVNFLPRLFNKAIVMPWKRKMLKSCGNNVYIGPYVKINGWENVVIGNDCVIGPNMNIISTRANVNIGDHVVFGPNVTVVTGNHRIDVVGKYISEIGDDDKRPEDDMDVVFEGDNWIGTNAIILKGVKIGMGSVIAAGAVVTHDTEPYSIMGGVPAKKITMRFNDENIKKHCQLLQQRKTGNQ